ncbi:SRPBCC family protein [Leptospira idonii]|uniref:SRPBCC domain-containing protein n=1 Tax=Leptospira idonii TaxID=1193500 RepID=A0A4R9M2E4_9LEPT|nr:SRPBCC domain-containing protein [Leptospira idonii]TGN20035.1 SRPBCC domain-containing protein [Leptospira idonii]
MSQTNQKEFSISRVLDAPRELVWKAWTEPARLAEWWGPKGFVIMQCTVDFRPGGIFHYGMRSPEGFEMWGKFIYQEIVPPEKMTYLLSFSDKDQGSTRHPGALDWPLEILNTVTLKEENGKTKLTLQAVPYNATEEECRIFEEGHPSMEEGFGGTFEQLVEYLKKAGK